MKTIVFDTETTGLPLHPSAPDERQPRIIEFACVLLDDDNAVIDEYETLIFPGCKLPAEITKITGITDDDLRGQPIWVAVMDEIKRRFAAADRMVAHNLPFDTRLVQMELDRHGIKRWPWPQHQVCTVQEWYEHYGYRPKLINLYEDLTGEPFEQKHRALDDVMKLAEVWRITDARSTD